MVRKKSKTIGDLFVSSGLTQIEADIGLHKVGCKSKRWDYA